MMRFQFAGGCRQAAFNNFLMGGGRKLEEELTEMEIKEEEAARQESGLRDFNLKLRY